MAANQQEFTRNQRVPEITRVRDARFSVAARQFLWQLGFAPVSQRDLGIHFWFEILQFFEATDLNLSHLLEHSPQFKITGETT